MLVLVLFNHRLESTALDGRWYVLHSCCSSSSATHQWTAVIALLRERLFTPKDQEINSNHLYLTDRPAFDAIAREWTLRHAIPRHLFVWQPSLHQYAPEEIKQVVHTTTMIRSLEPLPAISALPNELLFIIFHFL